MCYQFEISRGWTVQPDLEYWQHPKGGTTPDTWLGLVRIMYALRKAGGWRSAILSQPMPTGRRRHGRSFARS